MRTMFFEMHLLNDASFMNSQYFIWNGMQRGESKREGERDGERDREWLRKGCGVGHKIDCWSIIYEGDREKDNPRLYQDGNKAYHKNFQWVIFFSMGTTTFHPSDKLTINHTFIGKSNPIWSFVFL